MAWYRKAGHLCNGGSLRHPRSLRPRNGGWRRWLIALGALCFILRGGVIALRIFGWFRPGTIVAVSAPSSWVHNNGSNIPTSRTLSRGQRRRRRSITVAASLGWEFA